jgi:hypothetical protein
MERLPSVVEQLRDLKPQQVASAGSKFAGIKVGSRVSHLDIPSA